GCARQAHIEACAGGLRANNARDLPLPFPATGSSPEAARVHRSRKKSFHNGQRHAHRVTLRPWHWQGREIADIHARVGRSPRSFHKGIATAISRSSKLLW